jgi:hypothetical protein
VFRETEEDNVGGMIPFGDPSRRPRRFPAVTTVIIFVNALVFVSELVGGDAFVQRWSVIPADIVAGRHWNYHSDCNVHARGLAAEEKSD